MDVIGAGNANTTFASVPIETDVLATLVDELVFGVAVASSFAPAPEIALPALRGVDVEAQADGTGDRAGASTCACRKRP